MSATQPGTAAGRALLERWPFRTTKQDCCDMGGPHLDESMPVAVFPVHKRVNHYEYHPDAILAIEAEAAAAERERWQKDVQHALDALNAASDKMGYGDSVESDLLEAHATLDSILDAAAGGEGEG